MGSEPGCDVCLRHPSVSRRHAILRVGGDGILLEDLGSANGTLVGSSKIQRRRVAPGDPIYFGRVAASVEEVPDRDLEAGIELGPAAPGNDMDGEPAASTAAMQPVETFALEHLPGLLALVNTGATLPEMAQQVGAALYSALPCLEVEVSRSRGESEGLLFRAAFEGQPGAEPVAVTRHNDHGVQIRAVFGRQGLASAYEPLISAGVELLHGFEPGRPRRPRAASPGPATAAPSPPSVVPAVRELYAQAARVARGEVSVLITGESGTGKEVLARFIHGSSHRAERPFVALNCAALPRDLLEAELFGIERGVATGVDSRPGKFELADQGTLFLDEIGDMGAETQASILRVLEEGEVYRLGGREARPARIRTLAATNKDLRAQLADGRFRDDLYHRIGTWVVEMPPLRHRRADIPNLAGHFLAQEAERLGHEVVGISRAAVDALSSYPWPGNIRQLQNEIARAVLFLEPGELLDTARLTPDIVGGGAGAPRGRTLRSVIQTVERDEILVALERAGGDIDLACGRLGVSRATLYRKMSSLDIEPP